MRCRKQAIDEQAQTANYEETLRLINLSRKLRGGLPASGVEGLPETGRPLDPEPGLGGNV
jgi:hypothetical protein